MASIHPGRWVGAVRRVKYHRAAREEREGAGEQPGRTKIRSRNRDRVAVGDLLIARSTPPLSACLNRRGFQRKQKENHGSLLSPLQLATQAGPCLLQKHLQNRNNSTFVCI